MFSGERSASFAEYSDLPRVARKGQEDRQDLISGMVWPREGKGTHRQHPMPKGQIMDPPLVLRAQGHGSQTQADVEAPNQQRGKRHGTIQHGTSSEDSQTVL